MTRKQFKPNRKSIDIDELKSLNAAKTVFLDSKRTRPLWFDGRFAKASDFNRQTEYFLARQADLSLATGTGVVEGLGVSFDSNNNRLNVQPGFGVTDQGERVVVGKEVTMQLSNIHLIRELNAKLGLSKKPKTPLRTLNGIYTVILRPLEYTANPIASYPTDVDDQRSLHDGDVVEATAISLIEVTQNIGSFDDSISSRAELADSVFTQQSSLQVPPNTLPLAVIKVSNGVVRWVDNNLVRRDMGTAFSDVLGFGVVPRVLRHAHFKQYDEMYTDVIDQRGGTNTRFAASDYFISLPSAGKMPTASVDMEKNIQYFFPDSMDVDISVIPEDEIAPLLEESLLLPPIELNSTEEEQDAIAVMVLVPVPRIQFQSLLRNLKKKPPVIKLSKSAFLSRRKPRDLLSQIQNKLPEYISPERLPTDNVDEVDWRTLIGSQKNLWYVRRRHLTYKEEVVGKVVNVLADEFSDETEMRRGLTKLELYDDFVHLKVKGSAAADMNMVRLLTIPKITRSELLTRSALLEFKGEKKLSEQSVNKVNDRFSQPEVGTGIEKIESGLNLNRDQVISLASTKSIPELDFVARTLPEESLTSFTDELKERLSGEKPQAPATLAKFIKTKMKEIEQ